MERESELANVWMSPEALLLCKKEMKLQRSKDEAAVEKRILERIPENTRHKSLDGTIVRKKKEIPEFDGAKSKLSQSDRKGKSVRIAGVKSQHTVEAEMKKQNVTSMTEAADVFSYGLLSLRLLSGQCALPELHTHNDLFRLFADEAMSDGEKILFRCNMVTYTSIVIAIYV
tara:strand:- start:1230 stop:1745 length:516 start_codon:yes stop_codon:yes gene_type:complete